MSNKETEIPEDVRKTLRGEGEEKEKEAKGEVEEGETYTCPKCGKEVPYFMVYGESYTPVCEHCGSPVKKEDIPEESIIKVPSKEQQKGMKKTIEQGGAPSPPERSTEGRKKKKGFYKQPREAHEVLEDLLRDWDFDEDDIQRLVNHSKRVGGVHPVELRNKLTQMRGGLGNTADASMFAREYAEELRKEQQKAQRLDVRINYPIENYQQGAGAPRGQPTGTGRQGVPQGGPQGGDEIDKALRILDKFQTMKDRSGGGGDKYMTKQEFRKMMLEQQNEQLQRQIQGLRQQMNTLAENQGSQPAASGEYRDDWFRLVHDSTMALKDVVDKKEPVKLIVKSLGEQAPVEQAPKARETSRSKSEIPDMIDRRYVATQQSGQQPPTESKRQKPQQSARQQSSKGQVSRKEDIKKRKSREKKE